MKEASKHPKSALVTSSSDLRSFFSVLRMRRTKLFLYGFFFAFIAYTAYIAFNPTAVADASAPWYNNLLASASNSTAPYRSQISSLFSYIFPNSSSPVPEKAVPLPENTAPLPEKTAEIGDGSGKGGILVANETSKGVGVDAGGINRTELAVGSPENGSLGKNESAKGVAAAKGGGLAAKNQTGSGIGPPGSGATAKNQTGSGTTLQSSGDFKKNQTEKGGSGAPTTKDQSKDGVDSKAAVSIAKNQTVSEVAAKNQTTNGVALTGNGIKKTPPSSPQVSGSASKNQTSTNTPTAPKNSPVSKNLTIASTPTVPKSSPMANNKSVTTPAAALKTSSGASNQSSSATASVPKSSPTAKDESAKATAPSPKTSSSPAPMVEKKGTSSVATKVSNLTASLTKGNGNVKKMEDWIKEMKGCDIFHGKWVKDDSYPMYPEGSCPHIDEPFDCYRNGRPDRAYQKLRWQPNGCNIPRLNATDMLERLRGKRLVYVGDSLNRNMWESLVCILRNSIKDKKKVFEASGRHEFRTEGSYSFLFKDYNCTVEFFRSPFLVQEWEAPVSKGKTKETLRLDIIEQHSSKYKNADVIVFNTGHWWTHEKTSKGKDYYQEGNHVYGELNVVEAFHKALNTWAKWVDTNVNSKKTLVLFRGYSASHFSGGQWNSGGQCDKETEPIVNEKYLSMYPPKMAVLESVIKGMKTPVSYLNITRMTDYRKDAHPSIYRKQNLSEEERRSPERYQDCSHWCLPGVPDSWNEILYAQLLLKQHQ